MTQLKAFALLVVVAFTIDLAVTGGWYRRELGREAHVAAARVADHDWSW